MVEESFRFYCVRSFPVGCVTQPTAIQGGNLVRLQIHKDNVFYLYKNR